MLLPLARVQFRVRTQEAPTTIAAEGVRNEIAALPGVDHMLVLLERLARDKTPLIVAR